MKKSAFFKVAILSTFLSSNFTWANVSDSTTLKLKLVGMGSFESGEVMQGEPSGGEQQQGHVWYQRFYMRIGFDTKINDRTDLTFIGEGMTHFSWKPSTSTSPDNNRTQSTFYPYDVEGNYIFGNIHHPFLKVGFGVFPFKYDPDVRNLGEYLYRTNTYPPTMTSEFDYPLARLTGFKMISTPIDSLNLTALLTTESQQISLEDFSLSFLGSYTIAKAITIGAGIDFSRIFSVSQNLTAPVNSGNIYKIDTIYSATDTTYKINYYTFAGTKVMGRLSFDPKVFIPLNIFGSNDLKIYSEIAFLGLQNYPGYYAQLWRRVPIMAGFNFPTFKLLDVLSIELEWYRWNYLNSYTTHLFGDMFPQPDPISDPNYNPKEDQLKWSVYAKRSLANNFSIIGQVAFDHMPLETNTFSSDSFFGEAMHKHGDWAWVLKSEFLF